MSSRAEIALWTIAIVIGVIAWRPVTRWASAVLDDWRPTPPDQVRTEHFALVGAPMAVFSAFVAVNWFPAPFPLWAWRALALLIVGLGCWSLLASWKNERLLLSGASLSSINAWGKRVDHGPCAA